MPYIEPFQNPIKYHIFHSLHIISRPAEYWIYPTSLPAAIEFLSRQMMTFAAGEYKRVKKIALLCHEKAVITVRTPLWMSIQANTGATCLARATRLCHF